MSVTIVQPYCECDRQDCSLRNLDSEGVCAITLDLTDGEWAALLESYDHSIYVASADCSQPADEGFALVERRDRFYIYGSAGVGARRAVPAQPPELLNA